jgi:hypothetical protein
MAVLYRPVAGGPYRCPADVRATLYVCHSDWRVCDAYIRRRVLNEHQNELPARRLVTAVTMNFNRVAGIFGCIAFCLPRGSSARTVERLF